MVGPFHLMTTQSKHTPGPWVVDERLDGDAPGTWVDTKQGTPIAFVSEHVGEAQAGENAKAISLLPDILEALRSLTFETSHYLHGTGDNARHVDNALANALLTLDRL